jgi:hypothetical protein
MARASIHPPARHVPPNAPRARRPARRIAPAVLLSLSLMIATPVAAAPHPHPQADASVIATWNEITITTVNGGVASPANFNYYAFVHLAMYNAVAAITGEYELYKWDGVAPKPASPEAAAAAAAHQVLESYFGDSAARDAQLAASLANVPNPVARANGEAFGILAANHIIGLRAGDGRNAPVTVPVADAPGEWSPTPTGFAPFSTAWLGGVTPLAVTSTTQFAPGGPPALESAQYLADFAEVRDIGEALSARTPFQSQTARFFSDAGILPMQRALQELALRRGLDIDDSARLFAAVDTAIADGAGTVWAAKLQYMFWRPVTAIRASGLTTWSSYIPTPPYPDWPSGLTSVVGATGMVLERLGMLDLNITSTAIDAGPQPRHYADRATFNEDAINARVWSGIHFRFADTAGSVIGTNVANYVVDNYFQPAD